jgi:hypothetical protein
MLKGSIDQVRTAAARIKFLPIRGVEIIGYDESTDPSCAFLSSMHALRYLRVFARPLTDMEAIESLERLQALKIQHVGKRQSISLSFHKFSVLDSIVLEWFHGAENVFDASPLRSVSVMYCPIKTSEAFLRLSNLVRIHLSSSELTEINAFARIINLVWIALHDLRSLINYTGLSGHKNIRFLWIERCQRLRSLEFLRGMSSLETLRILDCGEITDIKALASLRNLRHIHIHGDIRVINGDFDFLRDLPRLESVIIKGLPNRDIEYWKRRNRKYLLLRPDLVNTIID